MLVAGMDLQDVFGFSQRAQGSQVVRSAQAENILSIKPNTACRFPLVENYLFDFLYIQPRLYGIFNLP